MAARWLYKEILMNTLITKGKRAAFPLMLLSTLLFSNTLLADRAGSAAQAGWQGRL